MRSLRWMPSTSSAIAVGWSPFGSIFGLDLEAHAAFGFFRARRPVRRPHFQRAVVALEFGTAVADQVFQRLGGGLDAERLHLVARRTRQRLVVVFRGRQAQLPRQLRIERRESWRRCRSWPAGLRRSLRGVPRVRLSADPACFSSTLPRKRGRGRGGAVPHGRDFCRHAPGASRRALPTTRLRAGGLGEGRRIVARAAQHPASPHHRSCRASTRARDARRPRRRRGDPRNYPAAAAGRWTSRCRFRRG